MAVTILSYLHNATTLLFGIYISAAFLGILMNRRNILTLLGFSVSIGIIYLVSYYFLGTSGTRKIYPLIIHLPLILFLTFFYHYRLSLSSLTVVTTYLCCQISNWIGIAVLDLTGLEWAYYSVRIFITVLVFLILIHFVSSATAQLLLKPTREIVILGFLPFIYYLFDYLTTVYTTLMYSGMDVVVEFLGFMICIFYLLFLLLYFKQYEEKREAEQRSQLMNMQQTQSQKEIEAIRRSEYTISLLRHDMRHFLSNLSVFIEQGELDRAQDYIHEIIRTSDQTARHRYCKNELVNMILSAHEPQIKNSGIDFQYSIQIPEQLSVSDMDMTAILSNALENAIHATVSLAPENRRIILNFYRNNDKLLLSIKNTFAKAPVFVDGMPQTTAVGHGLGTKSIHYITEKLHGNCQFFVSGEYFVLQIIL